MDTDTDRCINLINDMQVCPRCTSKLVFDTVRYHHIGKAHCPECGFSSPNCDYEGHDVNLMDMTMQIRDKDGSEESYRLINESVFNIYNIVAVTAVMREMGYSKERVSELLISVLLRPDSMSRGLETILSACSFPRTKMPSQLQEYLITSRQKVAERRSFS